MVFCSYQWNMPTKTPHNTSSIRTAFGFRIWFISTLWLLHKRLFKMGRKSRQKMMLQNKKLAAPSEELVVLHVGVLSHWAAGRPVWGSCRLVSFRKEIKCVSLVCPLVPSHFNSWRFFPWTQQKQRSGSTFLAQKLPSLSFQLILCLDT